MAEEMVAEHRLYYQHKSEEAAGRLTTALVSAENMLASTSDPESHWEAWLAWQTIFLQDLDLIGDAQLRKRLDEVNQLFLDVTETGRGIIPYDQDMRLDRLKRELLAIRVDLAHHRRGESLPSK